MNRKIASLLGLTQVAKKMVTGEESCEKAISSLTAKLVIISTDASENTKNKFINKCIHYNIKYILYSTKDDLSYAIGKQNRATFVIIDENFANKVHDMIKQES